MTAALRRSLTSLEVPNYRRYFAGQLVSVSGNWTQVVAEMWLILALTGSGVAVGLVSALQFLPILLFGAWGGLLADRLSKRRLLMATQMLMALPALGLFTVTAAGIVAPWMVFALVFARGAVNAIDNPTRQSFAIEMVGPDRLVNAVGLNSVLIHAARIVGPAVGGTLILTLGVAPCFLVNALSFGAMIVALRGMDPAQLRPAAPAAVEPGGVRAALTYVRSTPGLAIPLAMMAVVGTLGFNFQTMLPLLARFAFHGGAAAYTALAVAMGIGSVAGALVTGARSRIGPGMLTGAAFAFGGVASVAAAAPTLPVAAALLVPLGAASVMFAAGVNSTLQLAAAPQMRGRVMALYAIVFLGSTPIGGPLVGWLAGAAGPRSGLVLAGAAGLVAAAGARIAFARFRNHGPRDDLADRCPGRDRARDRDHDAGDRRGVRREGRARPEQRRSEHRPGERVRDQGHVAGAPRAEADEALPGHGHDRLAR
ncbi:MAG TPA: MFS transporter [Solirubrobacterales bacterium]|nr:MFS transporter [Solirubrobacterales bacterium]